MARRPYERRTPPHTGRFLLGLVGAGESQCSERVGARVARFNEEPYGSVHHRCLWASDMSPSGWEYETRIFYVLPGAFWG